MPRAFDMGFDALDDCYRPPKKRYKPHPVNIKETVKLSDKPTQNQRDLFATVMRKLKEDMDEA